MELFLLALCWLLLALGFLGCFINKVPGPLAVAIATFIGIVGLNLPIGWGVFTLITILAVGSMFLTKILVELVKTKMHEYSKRGSWGTTIGSLLGLLILMGVGPEEVGTTVIMFIFSFILLPFVFAFLL